MSSVRISELEQITSCSTSDDILIPIALKSGTAYVSKALTIEALQSIIGNTISGTDAYTSLQQQIEDIKNNATGADTFEWEFIYKLTNKNTTPTLTESSDAHYIDNYIPDGWLDDAPVVTSSEPYCWAALRYKVSASRWSSFGTPFIWSVFGQNGRDGNSVEYIFKASTEVIPSEERTSSVIMQGLDVNSDSYQKADVVPEGWADDPADMINYKYQYMSYRKYNGSKWGKFQDSILWSYRASDGEPAESGAIIDFGNDMGAIPFIQNGSNYEACKVDGVIESTTAYVNLSGSNITPDNIGFSTTDSTNISTLSTGETITINDTTFKVTKQTSDWLIQVVDAKQVGHSHDVKIWFTIEDENLNTIKVSKVFKLIEITPGADGTAVNYQIVPTATQISCDSDGNNPQPSNVTFNVVKYTNGVPSTCSLDKDLYLVIDKDGTDTGIRITSSNNATVYASDFASYVTANLYYNNEIVDCETIRKSKDGAPYTYLKFGTPDLSIFSVNSDGSPTESLDDNTQWELPIYIYKGDVLQSPEKYLDENSETLAVNIDGKIVEDKSLYKVIVYDDCLVLSISYTVLKQLVFTNINPNTINLTLISNTDDGTLELTGSYTIYKSIKGESASLLYNIIASNDSVLLDDTSDASVLKQVSLNEITVYYNGVKQSVALTVDEDALASYNFKIKVDGATTYLEYADSTQCVNMSGLEKRTAAYIINISINGEIIGQVTVNILIWSKISTDGSVPMLQIIPPTFTSKTSKGKAQITLKKVGSQSSTDLELGISADDSDYWVCLKAASGDTTYGSSIRSIDKKTVTISNITYNDITNGLYCYLYWKDVLLSREHLEYIFNSQETYSGSGEFLIDPSSLTATFTYSPVGTASYIIYTFKDCAELVNISTLKTKQGDLKIITSETDKDVSIIFPKTTATKGSLKDVNFNGLEYSVTATWLPADQTMLNSIHWNTCTSVVISYYSSTYQLLYENTIVRTGMDGYYFNVDETGLLSIQSSSENISSLYQNTTELVSTISTSLRHNLLSNCEFSNFNGWYLNDITNCDTFKGTSTVEQSLGNIVNIPIVQKDTQSTSWQGIYTTVVLEANKNYTFSCFFQTELDPTNPVHTVSIGPEEKTGLVVDKCTYKGFEDDKYWQSQAPAAVDYGTSRDIAVPSQKWYQATVQFHTSETIEKYYVMRLYGNIVSYVENAEFHFANVILYDDSVTTSVSKIAQDASSIVLDVCDEAGLEIRDKKVNLKGAVQATNFSFLKTIDDTDKPVISMCSKKDLLENDSFKPDSQDQITQLKDELSGFDDDDILIVQYSYTNGKEVKYYAALTALGGLTNIVVGYINYVELKNLDQVNDSLYTTTDFQSEINGVGAELVSGNYSDEYKSASEYYINIPSYKKAYILYDIKEQALKISTTSKNFTPLTTEYIGILSASRSSSKIPDKSSAIVNQVYHSNKGNDYAKQAGLLLEIYKYNGSYLRYGQCILLGNDINSDNIYYKDSEEQCTVYFLNGIELQYFNKTYSYQPNNYGTLINYQYDETNNYVEQKNYVASYFEEQENSVLKNILVKKYNTIIEYDSSKNYSFPAGHDFTSIKKVTSIPVSYTLNEELIYQNLTKDSNGTIYSGIFHNPNQSGDSKNVITRIITFDVTETFSLVNYPNEITINSDGGIYFKIGFNLNYSGLTADVENHNWEINDVGTLNDKITSDTTSVTSKITGTFEVTISSDKIISLEVWYDGTEDDLGYCDNYLESIKDTLKTVIDEIDFNYIKEQFTVQRTKLNSILFATASPDIYLNATADGVQTVKLNNVVPTSFLKSDTILDNNLSTNDITNVLPTYRNIFGFYNQSPDNLIKYNNLINKVDNTNIGVKPISCILYTLNNGDLYASIVDISTNSINQKSKTISFRFKDSTITSGSFK